MESLKRSELERTDHEPKSKLNLKFPQTQRRLLKCDYVKAIENIKLLLF